MWLRRLVFPIALLVVYALPLPESLEDSRHIPPMIESDAEVTRTRRGVETPEPVATTEVTRTRRGVETSEAEPTTVVTRTRRVVETPELEATTEVTRTRREPRPTVTPEPIIRTTIGSPTEPAALDSLPLESVSPDGEEFDHEWVFQRERSNDALFVGISFIEEPPFFYFRDFFAANAEETFPILGEEDSCIGVVIYPDNVRAYLVSCSFSNAEIMVISTNQRVAIQATLDTLEFGEPRTPRGWQKVDD